MVLVVAGDRVRLVLERAPAVVVVRLEIRQRTVGILGVAQREHGVGVEARDEVRGLLLRRSEARAGDVARGGDRHRGGRGDARTEPDHRRGQGEREEGPAHWCVLLPYCVPASMQSRPPRLWPWSHRRIFAGADGPGGIRPFRGERRRERIRA